MKQRALYLLTTYLLTVVIFIAAKIVFMLCNTDGHAFAVGDVFDVITHGLTLDLSTALYFLIVPFLVIFVSIYWYKKKVFIRILNTYNLMIATAFSLAFVADTSLYKFWQFKLDAFCLQYLETPTEAMASVSWWYIAIRLVVFILLVLIIYKAYSLLVRSLRTVSPQASDWKSAAFGLLAFLVAIPIFIIGIRGGLAESTTNIGQVYYSQDQFLNHSAVNPVFSFLSSFEKTASDNVTYQFMTDEECATLTDGLFCTDSCNPDTLLKTKRPNIVIIVMESCGGQFTEIGGHLEIMPRLNSLIAESVYFTECYANSWRTDKGMVSILSGYPAFPITSVMKNPEKSRKLPSIASSLSGEGYSTAFFYGGDINFTNMRSYVMSSGYQRLRWKADYSYSEQHSSQWGVCDELMFNSLYDDIANEKSAQWMKTMLTLSSHEPWDVPTKHLDDPVYNAFNYLDICIGNFIDRLRKLPAWDNMLVVVLPDHGYRYKGINETTQLYNHIPMLWLGGALKKPDRIDVLCNQSDLAATLLGQMGIQHSEFSFSRDVASQNYCHHMAWHTFNNGVTLYDSTGFATFDLDANIIIASKGNDTERQVRQSKALLQLTSQDLKKK